MPNDPHSDLVERICRLIDRHADETLTLDDLADAFDVSPGHLQRVFKRVLGVTPRQYQSARRLERFKSSLREQTTVTEALHLAGYGSPSRVYEKADERLGMTPGEYRTRGATSSIRFTTADCSLGRLLLAGTDRGVCAVYLGDDDGELERELAREFSAARRGRDDSGLAPWVEQVRLHLEGDRDVALPLDVRATAFQWRVWQHLRTIPRGTTQTYTEVAAALGQPTAARAVARACATNPVSILVPCHRVVREDGSLAGYRWGLHRKRELLDREQKPE